MEKNKSEQKRQQGGLRVAIDGQYRFPGDQDWLNCTVFDLSPSGMALGGKQSFYAGDKIEVRLVLEKRSVVAQVEVTNLIGKKAGGKIVLMNEDDRTHVQEILNRELLSGNARLT